MSPTTGSIGGGTVVTIYGTSKLNVENNNDNDNDNDYIRIVHIDNEIIVYVLYETK